MNGKDLIDIGIFSAIYFAIVFVVAMMGMIPIFQPLLSVILTIIGGLTGRRLMKNHIEMEVSHESRYIRYTG